VKKSGYKISKGETMTGNFSYQTPGTYKVFFMDLSSVIISALSQYDARKKASAAYSGKLVSHAQLINQTKEVYLAHIPTKSIEVKAKDITAVKINY
jgi:hypothetical protein